MLLQLFISRASNAMAAVIIFGARKLFYFWTRLVLTTPFTQVSGVSISSLYAECISSLVREVEDECLLIIHDVRTSIPPLSPNYSHHMYRAIQPRYYNTELRY